MGWKALDTVLATFCLPVMEHDVPVTREFTYVPAFDVNNAFLYTSSDYAGCVEVKVEGTSEWIELGEFSTNPALYIGAIDEGYEVDFEVRVTLDDSFDGEQTIPIYVGSGESITPPLPGGVSWDFWLGGDTDRDFFIDNDTEFDNYSWQSEGDIFAAPTVAS